MQKITENILWTGIKDWDLRHFHGQELSTQRGTTYNAYIILDKKNVLVDTVWPPHALPFMDEIRAFGVENIDAIIINHMEPDHGGTLGMIMDIKPDIPIYCTQKGKEIITSYFRKDWNFVTVKTGDTLDIGENTLTFVEMKMIHWPDSMMVYADKEKVLFSNDAFGQHYCTKSLFNDEVDNHELYQEAIKYYANILTPFASLIKSKVLEINKLGLDVKIIAPSHGVLWRENPFQIVEKYLEWSDSYQEDFVVVIYDTMYQSTKKMAEGIEKGLRGKGVLVKLYNAAVTDPSYLLTEIFKSKGMAVGSCTVNNGAMASIHTLVHEIRSHKFKDKPFLAFGSHGWSGEAARDIHEGLLAAKLSPVANPVTAKYNPGEDVLEACEKAGAMLADILKI
ncbi:MAG: MBL fold metallo-hydrolase [Clostridia bacterium]